MPGAPGSLVGSRVRSTTGDFSWPVPALRTEQLTKRFGRLMAVDGLDLTVRGRRGVRVPRSERRRQVHHHPAAARPGPSDGRPGLDLRRAGRRRRRRAPRAGPRARRCRAVAEADRRRDLELLGRIGPGSTRPTATSWCSGSRLDLSRRAGTYSTGNRQKVALVAAFATRAPLLVLDEPTSGLDPLMEREFRDVVRARPATAARRSSSAPTSWPRSRPSATGSGSCARAGSSTWPPSPELRRLHRTEVAARLAGPRLPDLAMRLGRRAAAAGTRPGCGSR